MDELEKNIPDNFWQKAFDEAAETPPPRVWDAIERRLDESDGARIIPLWGSGLASSRPVVWGTGMAAALALLVVGWWAIRTPSADQSVARLRPSSPAENVAIAPAKPTTNSSASKSPGQSSKAIASVGKPSAAWVQPLASTISQPPTRSVGKSTTPIITMPSDKDNPLNQKAVAATILSGLPTGTTMDLLTPASSRMTAASFTTNRIASTEAISSNQSRVAAFGQLTGKPLHLRSVGPIQRIVWFQAAELPMEAEFIKEKRKKRELWASASVMPGSFNPSVSVPSAQSTFNNSLAAMTAGQANQSAVSSRANFSVAYQAGAGVQLTERWSIESGIGYLAGHSTVESPAQSVALGFVQGVSADRITATNNLYVDALRYSSPNNAASSTAQAGFDKMITNNAYLSKGNYSNQTIQTLTNDYQYVQVPLQVGYQLRPRKRISLAVLGGLITNIFVRNTVGTDLVVTAKDGVYRPVSLAATMGARVRYRPAGRWSASLAGLYQPSLGLSTEADSQVQSRPTSTGMSFGVDYHF